MSTYVTTGFVLHSRPWREGDRLYTLYTASQGKLELIAAGSQKLSSKLSPHLQPFARVEVMVARGKQRDRLASANLQEHYLKPPYQLPSLTLGSALLEATDVLTREEQPEPKLYELLRQSLAELSSLPDAGGDWRPPARWLLARFTVEALKLLGLGVLLTHCEHCHRELQDPVEFSWSRHGFFHRACSEPAERRVPLPPAAYRWLSQAAQGGVGAADTLPASALAFLTDYLGGQVGRELYTLKVLRSIL